MENVLTDGKSNTETPKRIGKAKADLQKCEKQYHFIGNKKTAL